MRIDENILFRDDDGVIFEVTTGSLVSLSESVLINETLFALGLTKLISLINVPSDYKVN